MIVKRWMSHPIVTVSPEDSMATARNLLNDNHIHALAVISNHRLVGLLTDRDLKRAEASDATSLDIHELNYLLEKVPVSRIMKRHPITIATDTTLPEAADLFLKHKTEAFPVMADKDHLVGMLTPTDLSKAFLKITAFGRRGVHFGIRVTDSPGTVMEIISLIRDIGARLASLVTTDSLHGSGDREAYVHAYQFNRDRLPELIDRLGHIGSLLYMVDLKTNERQIFER